MNGGNGGMNDASLVSTVMARVATDGKTARRLADGLAETLDPGQAAVAAFEARDGGWTVEIYFAQAPDAAALRRLVGDLAGDAARDRLTFETVAARDWVAASLEGLQPVEAGRFFLHGAHHRDRVRPNRIGIEIEAALAFGTGHHGTTRGCLLALGAIVKASAPSPRVRPPRSYIAVAGTAPLLPRPAIEIGCCRFRFFCTCRSRVNPTSVGERVGVRGPIHKLRLADRPPHPARKGAPTSPCARGEVKTATSMRTLDVGTGTGVLAIAAARSLRGAVLASDIDPMSVRLARQNARLNRAAGLTVILARGLGDRRFRDGAPYGLVFANILLGPLKGLAKPIGAMAAPGAFVVLSGLLPAQANAALAAYRAHGLVLVRRISLDGWATLVLRRPAKPILRGSLS
jgi:ribosomal protein L11 methylase PrmA